MPCRKPRAVASARRGGRHSIARDSDARLSHRATPNQGTSASLVPTATDRARRSTEPHLLRQRARRTRAPPGRPTRSDGSQKPNRPRSASPDATRTTGVPAIRTDSRNIPELTVQSPPHDSPGTSTTRQTSGTDEPHVSGDPRSAPDIAPGFATTRQRAAGPYRVPPTWRRAARAPASWCAEIRQALRSARCTKARCRPPDVTGAAVTPRLWSQSDASGRRLRRGHRLRSRAPDVRS